MDTHFPFEKTALPYSCSALLPPLDPDTVYFHYNRIYYSYVDQLNDILDFYPQLHNWPLKSLIMGEMNIPTVDQNIIRHLAGGIYAHKLYFSTLSRTPKPEPHGQLRNVIEETYGSFSEFKTLFGQAAASILGVGWVWLNATHDGAIHIAVTESNRTPSLTMLTPVLVLDTWEHAYYLKYITELSDYIDSWFKLLDWTVAEQKFESSLKKGAASRSS